jgi:hypothetical protein
MEYETKRIPLRNRVGKIVAYTLVDQDDFLELSKYSWYLQNGYAARSIQVPPGKSRAYRMHRQILGLKFGEPRMADHKNTNKLDNRKRNLRIATAAQNMQNQHPRQNCSSVYRGVNLRRENGKWRARVTIEGVGYFLGDFEREEDAAKVAKDFRLNNMPYTTS